MIVYYDLLLVFKIRQDKKPVYLYNKFSQKYAYPTRFSNNNEIRQVQLPKSEIKKSAFVNRSTVSWNNLPNDLTNLKNYKMFKIQLRRWVKENIAIS